MTHRILSRRRLIGLLGVTMAVPLLNACGGAPPAAPVAPTAAPAKPAAAPASTTAPVPAAAAKAPAAAQDFTIKIALNGTPEKANGMKG